MASTQGIRYATAEGGDGRVYALFREGQLDGEYRLDFLGNDGWHDATGTINQWLYRGAWEVSETRAREIARRHELTI